MHFNTVLLISGGGVQALQLLAALSLLIILHEFGHFFFARLFKTRVEKFYLFFDFLFPFSGLFNFSLLKKKKGDTEYGIGWFPLGGYVKISGMVDESMDKDALALPPQPWEYRSKKAWQRLFIMLGGIIMNVLVAISIYMLIFNIWGEEYLPTQNATYGIMVDSTAQSIGLHNGDKIVSIDGKEVSRFNRIMPILIFKQAKSIQVSRNGQDINVPIPEGTIRRILDNQKAGFIQPRVPIVVADVAKKTAADSMGLKENDSIVAVNNVPVKFYDEFLKLRDENAGKPVTVTVIRNKTQLINLHGYVPADKILGFVDKGGDEYFNYTKIKYNPISAIGRGVTYTWEKFQDYWLQFKMIFTSKEVKISKSAGGFISFGKAFSPVFTWFDFLTMTAFISVILAFMNLLPIPGLDGGYVLFLIWEIITRRKVSEKVMERATTVGLILLLVAIVYFNGLDVMRLFKK